jgi:hypothetical protein
MLMADNRNPIMTDLYQAPYYSLAAAVNFDYCLKHGYEFRYFQTSKSLNKDTDSSITQSIKPSSMELYIQQVVYHLGIHYMNLRALRVHNQKEKWVDKTYFKVRRILTSTLVSTKPTNKNKSGHNCVHHKLGHRSAPWSKLPAIHQAMQEDYDRIVYIDSDAIFNIRDMSLDDFLLASSSTLAAIEEAHLTLTYNYPWTDVLANSGFMIWKNTDRAHKILRTWWNTDAGKHHFEHDYEQYALNSTFLSKDNKSEFQNDIAIIPAITFLERRKQFLRHVGIIQKRLRVLRFRQALSMLNIGPEKFKLLIEKIKERHLYKFDTIRDTVNLTNGQQQGRDKITI